MSKQAKRYRLATLPGRVTRDSVEVVEAYDYDALAAQLAEARDQRDTAQAAYEDMRAAYRTATSERDEARAELAATKRLAAMMTKAAADHAEIVVALRAAIEKHNAKFTTTAMDRIPLPSAANASPHVNAGDVSERSAGADDLVRCGYCDEPWPDYWMGDKHHCQSSEGAEPPSNGEACPQKVDAWKDWTEAGAEPKALKIWYMRDNHTFRPLPLDVHAAMAAIREEWNEGYTYGMLCSDSRIKPNVHGRGDWNAFVPEAMAWLERAIEQQKTALPEGG